MAFIITQANAPEHAEIIAKIEAGLKSSLLGLMIRLHPIIIGININHVAELTDSFKRVNANKVTKNGANLVSIDAFASSRWSIEQK